MDHTRDNPLKRFTAFWVAVLLVATFGVGTLIFLPLTLRKVDSAYQENSEVRLATKSEITKAEAAAVDPEALKKAIIESARTLAAQEPTPGSMAVPSDAPAAPVEGDASPEEAAPDVGAGAESAPAETNPEPSN